MKKELSNKVSEVLKDERIINALKNNFQENNGFLIGKIEYFDDINVLILSGITLDKRDKSKAKIFSYQLFPHNIKEGYNFELGDNLPEIPSETTEVQYPTIDGIDQRVKEFLKDPKSKLIDYARFLKKI